MFIIIDLGSSIKSAVITIGKRSKTVSLATYVSFFAMIYRQKNEHLLIEQF